MKAALMVFISLGLALRLLLLPGEGMIKLDCPYAEKTKFSINLGGFPFFLAAKVIGDKDPEVSELLASIKAAKIRIYDRTALGEKKLQEVLNFYKEQLRKSEWEVLVSVKDKESTIGVYSLTKGNFVSGLVVLVGKPEELVAVNLAGKIDVTRLSQVGKIAGVDLPQLSSGRKKEQKAVLAQLQSKEVEKP
jgi:hypothetical protein